MDRKTNAVIYILIPIYVLHLIEEFMTGFATKSTEIGAVSQKIHLAPEITFLLVEIGLFIILGLWLGLVLMKLPTRAVAFIIAIISLYEFVHPYQIIKTMGYYPGSITGTLLAIGGVVLMFALVTEKQTS